MNIDIKDREIKYMNSPDADKNYIAREGVYGIMTNESGKIAIVETSTGYFLPGGGIEAGETAEECLKREFIEELGIEIKMGKFIGLISYYFKSTTLHIDMESLGNFYNCNYVKTLDVQTEPDHKLVWLYADRAIELLYLENQKEAVRNHMKF